MTSHDLFAPPNVEIVDRPDGTRIMSSRMPIADYPTSPGVWLRKWAAEQPDTVFLAERSDASTPWTTSTFQETYDRATRLGQSLLDLGLGPERPVVVLSGASIAHAHLMLAAHLVGVPIVPVSVAYSLVAQNLDRVHHIIDQTHPGLVFVEHTEPYHRVLETISDRQIVSGDGQSGRAFIDLVTANPTDVEAAFASVNPDDIAKILYTSGSTGLPKGVITTYRMMCANQQAMAQVWPFLAKQRPIICDWLPWSHTFGSSHNFNMALANGGTFYIDAGKPAPGLFEMTVANLADVRPTIAFNVPAGYARLVERLEADDDVAAAFFSRLQLIFYAAAALPQDVWSRLEAISRRITGRVVPMTSSWGLTETAPAATTAHFPLDRAGVIGTPLPGVRLKLVPSNDKTEIRVAGHSVTPGYFNDAEQTSTAFDEEGFFITGDAVRLADPGDPNAGLVFDGRVAEDFKLSTGTWVSVGTLRPAIVAAASPLLLDCVVTGHDRDWLGLLVWLAPGQVDDPAMRERLRRAIAQHNMNHNNTSSTRIRRAAILTSPPSIDTGETTDKGYINQRRALIQRADVVDRLYADPPDDEILVIDRDTEPTTDPVKENVA